jgi:hypothetical protein
MKIPERLKSRKLWVTILSPIVAAFAPQLLPLIKILAPAYLIGQGVADSSVVGILGSSKTTAAPTE